MLFLSVWVGREWYFSSLSITLYARCSTLPLFYVVRQNGALGSRLTGAGWGGCVVSLIPADKLQNFMSSINTGYYTEPLPPAVVGECVFASQPGDGAALYVFWWMQICHELVYKEQGLFCILPTLTSFWWEPQWARSGEQCWSPVQDLLFLNAPVSFRGRALVASAIPTLLCCLWPLLNHKVQVYHLDTFYGTPLWCPIRHDVSCGQSLKRVFHWPCSRVIVIVVMI